MSSFFGLVSLGPSGVSTTILDSLGLELSSSKISRVSWLEVLEPSSESLIHEHSGSWDYTRILDPSELKAIFVCLQDSDEVNFHFTPQFTLGTSGNSTETRKVVSWLQSASRRTPNIRLALSSLVIHQPEYPGWLWSKMSRELYLWRGSRKLYSAFIGHLWAFSSYRVRDFTEVEGGHLDTFQFDFKSRRLTRLRTEIQYD